MDDLVDSYHIAEHHIVIATFVVRDAHCGKSSK